MKTLFIIVSIVAIAYLALQTKTVKTMLHKAASYTAEELSQLKNDDAEASEASINTKLNEEWATVSKLAKKTSDENKILVARVNNLENDVATLETVVTGLSPLLINNKAIDEPVISAKKIAKETQVESIQAEVSSTITDSSEQSAQINTQQQKRMQQQAILRDLAQKMELAALSSLSN